MNKLKYILTLIILVAQLLYSQSYATDNHVPVRVGISTTDFKNYLFSTIEFNNAYSLTVTDSATGYGVPVKPSSSKIKVTVENNLFRIFVDGELVARNLSGPISIVCDGGFIYPEGIKRKGKPASYRGIIELVRSSKNSSSFAIVNVLSLKNYLRGVVPNEMPVKFGLEALKAQTVAARNYAVAPRVKAYNEFDLCDSVACQVYFGAGSEAALSDKAIEETDGIIAADIENKPILALYSSTAGGYTESYEYAFSDPVTRAFPSKDIHYLRAVPDKESFGELDTEEAAEKFYMSSPEAFDDNSPYYRWTKEWTKSELEQVLAKTLVSQSSTGFVHPALKNSADFGKLQTIQVLQRGKSGKIIRIAVKTDRNTFVVEKELVIRRSFQKNGVSLPSANFVIKTSESDNSVYKFYGGGFGHGVGLSQWGAGKMGSSGFDFTGILKHYYQGIKLITLPVELQVNGKTETRDFYADSNNAFINIQHGFKADKINVVINDKVINEKLSGHESIIDISKYLIPGKNKISYTLTSDKSVFGERVKVYIEFKEEKEIKSGTVKHENKKGLFLF